MSLNTLGKHGNYLLQELFQSVDRSHKGKISLSSLQDILSAALVIDLKADPQRWAHITDLIAPVSFTASNTLRKQAYSNILKILPLKKNKKIFR